MRTRSSRRAAAPILVIGVACAVAAGACSSTAGHPRSAGSTTSIGVSPAPAVIDLPAAPVDPPPLLAQAATACGRAGGATATATVQACTSAADAYVWGYALVAMTRTKRRFTCALGSNRLASATALAGPQSRSVVAPNNDTLYSTAWLDLRSGPMVLSFPAVSGRYADFQMMDAYTNTFADVGVLTTGGRAGRYAIVAPGWSGSLPAGVVRIDAPTPDVWLLGRTAVDGPADLAAVISLQHRYGLSPLVGTAVTPLTGGGGGCGPSPQQIANTGRPLFDEISADMAADPPLAQDHAVVAEMAKGGIGPGHHPVASGDAAAVAGYDEALSIGPELIAGGANQARVTYPTGWTRGRVVGTYGTDYVVRAEVAAVGLGANVPMQAVYFNAPADRAVLSGAHTYVIHFAAGQLPPIRPDGFWSLTLYDRQRFLVANPIDRYSIGDRTKGLVTNPNGSLDIFLAAVAPAGRAANWLPAPPAAFSVTLRVYAPLASVTNGTWVPPEVTETG